VIQRAPLSHELLQDSNDTLRTVVGLLDDVAPQLDGPASSPLDIHLAIAVLDRMYEIESASKPGTPARFRPSGFSPDRFIDPADAVGL
jgi:hypothetical protein